jgi:hypothetical protein
MAEVYCASKDGALGAETAVHHREYLGSAKIKFLQHLIGWIMTGVFG